MNIKDFKRIINSDIEIISTIDHPYTSPPSHIFDAHSYLMKKYQRGQKERIIKL